MESIKGDLGQGVQTPQPHTSPCEGVQPSSNAQAIRFLDLRCKCVSHVLLGACVLDCLFVCLFVVCVVDDMCSMEGCSFAHLVQPETVAKCVAVCALLPLPPSHNYHSTTPQPTHTHLSPHIRTYMNAHCSSKQRSENCLFVNMLPLIRICFVRI